MRKKSRDRAFSRADAQLRRFPLKKKTLKQKQTVPSINEATYILSSKREKTKYTHGEQQQSGACRATSRSIAFDAYFPWRGSRWMVCQKGGVSLSFFFVCSRFFFVLFCFSVTPLAYAQLSARATGTTRKYTKGTWTAFFFRRKRKKEQWQWVFWKHSVLESQSRKQHAERRLSLSLSSFWFVFLFLIQ